MLNQEKGDFKTVEWLIGAAGDENGSYCIMDTEFQFGMMTKF